MIAPSRLSALIAGIAVSTASLITISANPASAQQGQRPDGWFKVCAKQDTNDICNTQFQSVASTGQVITSVNLIEVTGETSRRLFQVTVPSGRLIPAGVKLRIDDKRETTLPYLYCFPERCVSQVDLDDNLIGILKAGGQMTVTSTNVQNRENPIEVTLSGFTAAYDGPPLQQEELANRQRELQDELRRKAEEARKKLQEAQDSAKSGSN